MTANTATFNNFILRYYIPCMTHTSQDLTKLPLDVIWAVDFTHICIHMPPVRDLCWRNDTIFVSIMLYKDLLIVQTTNHAT